MTRFSTAVVMKGINTAVAVLLLMLLAQLSAAQTSTRDGVYTEAQAIAGGALYLRSCVECHGITLGGGEAGPALVGGAFWEQWQDQSLAAFTRSQLLPCR